MGLVIKAPGLLFTISADGLFPPTALTPTPDVFTADMVIMLGFIILPLVLLAAARLRLVVVLAVGIDEDVAELMVDA